MRTNIKKRIATFLLLFALVLTIGGELYLSLFSVEARAEGVDITTSSVRDDLASMDKDNLSNLSSDKNIFIGMSQYYDKDEKLRTYLYFNYIGSLNTKLFVSLSASDKDENNQIVDIEKTYPLSYVNSESTWVKYEILDLPNLDFVTRRYRLFDIVTSDNTSILNIDETFIFHGISNNSIEVFHQEVETITITDKQVSFFCYGEESGYFDFWGKDDVLGNNKTYTDAFYIFFNTDKEIDNLIEVEVVYKPYNYHIQEQGYVKMSTGFTEGYLNNRIEKGDFDEKTEIEYSDYVTKTIKPGTTLVESKSNWWGGYQTKYETLDNFLDLRSYDHLDDKGNPFIFTGYAKKYTWGVNIFNAKKTSSLGSVVLLGNSVFYTSIDGSAISDTAILRLKYEVNGIVKNAYAFDIPTSDFEGNSASYEAKDLLETIVALLGLILFFVFIWPILSPILSPIISTVFNFLIKGVKIIFSIFVKIILLPFKLIGKLFSSK